MLKYFEIMQVHKALDNISNKVIYGATYEIVRNLKTLNDIITSNTALMQTLYKKFADVDENGNLKIYDEPNGQQMNRISDPEKLAEFNKELEKLSNEDYDVELKTIPTSIINKLDIPSKDILPLLDIVFVDK